MALPPLVRLTDVVNRLPASMSVETQRATALIADASAVVRSFSNQQFNLSQTVANVRPIGYRVRLPQRPIVSVDAVALRLINQATPRPLPGWWWDGSDEVWLTNGEQIINLSEELAFALKWQTPMVSVTYTHGYAEVPQDVVAVVCSMVTRTLTAPGLGGVTSETAGEFSYRLSDAAAQGPMTLTAAEKDILRPYKPRKSATAELRW